MSGRWCSRRAATGRCRQRTGTGSTAILDRCRRAGGERRLIYAGFGSVLSADPGLLRRLVRVVAERPDWELVISLSERLASADLGPLPDRAHAFAWLPQLTVLRHADAAVTHGGINTVDECVLAGVPMLVYCGFETDMAGTTARVVHHGLGIAGDRRDGVATMRAHLDRLLDEPRFRHNVRRLRALYAAYAEERDAERAVEELLAAADRSGGHEARDRGRPTVRQRRRLALRLPLGRAAARLRLHRRAGAHPVARRLRPGGHRRFLRDDHRGAGAFDVNKALIRTRETERALYDSAWTLSVLRGVAAALFMLAIAPFLADARIGAVLSALALSPLLSGLSNPRFVTFERDLVYSRLAALTLGAKAGSFCVTIVVAVVTGSYWALVLGLLAGSLISLILSYALRPYRPRVSFARVADIFGFSGWLSLTTIVTTLSMETDKLIVGRLLGVADAGLYFMTQRVGVLPTRELISPLQRILFPSFSKLAEDTARLRRAACESINVLGSLSLPAGCGFALVAGDFVPLVLGDQWLAIVPLLTILVPYLGLRATLSMTLPCVMALGRTRLLFRVSVVYALVHVPAFVTGTVLFGLRGTIWSIVAAGVLYSYLNAWLLRRTLAIGLGEILSQLRRPLMAVALMVGAVLAVGAALPPVSGNGSWLSLADQDAGRWRRVLRRPVRALARRGPAGGIERRLRQLLPRRSAG